MQRLWEHNRHAARLGISHHFAQFGLRIKTAVRSPVEIFASVVFEANPRLLARQTGRVYRPVAL